MGKSFARLTIAIAIVSLAACSSGDEGNGTNNRAPTANAGSDQIVAEFTTVQLSGSGADPDAGDTVSFSWSQISGTTVTINNAGSANANFAAPDVLAGNPQVLGFRLTVTDSAGLTATDDVSITVQQPGPVVTISGNMRYEFPPPNPGCNGLNFSPGFIETRPIRQATVQALDETATVLLATDITDDTGAYSLTVAASTNVIIRVRAEVKRGGSPSWDVEVRNNVDTSPSPPPLAQRPLYVMDSSVMDSGVVDSTLDLTATTGWDTASMSYTDPRSAAPFSVLDTILRGMELVLTVDPTATFDPLDAFWSPDNTRTDGEPQDIDSGELGTSFYSADMLFLLGKEGVDAEEFDDHVIVHEWGHYFEDNFSRSDSIGGAHGVGDLLDKRVAFGEGWATALSGMALNDPNYCDTLWAGSPVPVLTGFPIDIEGHNPGTRGWFNEISLMRLIYDLWDTADDGADNSSIGFAPIHAVMTGPQAVTSAFTSIFSFAFELKSVTGQDAFINALLAEQNIATDANEFGDTETNDGPGAPADVLPVYTDITLTDTALICVNSQFDDGRDGNKLSEHRYLRLNLPTTQQVTFTMTANPAPSAPTAGFDCTADPNDLENHEHSDPDFTVWQDGVFYWFGFSCEPNTETTTTNGALPAGDYVIDVNDFRYEDEQSPAGYPEQVCFEFTAN